jgi:hypothetical protein
MDLVNQKLLRIAVALTQIAIAHAQSTGTVVALDISQDKATVAADSRVMNYRNGGYSDNQCKITTLDDKILFAFSGYSAADPRPGLPPWSAYNFARAAYSDIRNSPSADLPSSAAKAWTKLMLDQYQSDPAVPILAEGRPGFAAGLFIGFKQDGSISVNVVLFVRVPSLHVEMPHVHIPQLAVVGEVDIWAEYMERKTARSKAWHKKLEPLSPGQRVKEFVKLTEEFGTHTIKGVRDVGGPINVAQITKDGIVWLSKQPYCEAK